jgi:hypothetical protein
MSQENIDLVLESIRRFRPSGLDEWAELWHQDTRMTLPEGSPEPGPFIGLEAVKRQFERLFESFSVLRIRGRGGRGRLGGLGSGHLPGPCSGCGERGRIRHPPRCRLSS